MPVHRHISGRELLLGMLAHQDVPAVPWLPFTGVHAGKLIGSDATSVLTDANALVAALIRANELYEPDGQPVVFDLQLEAEILGCELAWASRTPPAVATHPLQAARAVPTALPERTQGRLPVVLDAMRRMKQAVGERTALFGLVCGPLTLASHMRGTDIFMDMFDDPEYVTALIEYCGQVAARMGDLYREAGMDVIACVDPVASQISPRAFGRFLSPTLSRFFGDLRQQGVPSALFVCGDATANLDPMCRTEPDALCIDENVDLAGAKQITDRYGIALGGNIPLTSVLLLGSQQDCIKWVVDTLEQVDNHNLILAPGCDMPYDTPPDNVIGVLQAVRDPARYRELVAHYSAPQIDYEIDLPRYESLPRPLVEVFTLDSESCAACGYMLSAAERACAELGGLVDMIEYRMTVRENIARMKLMGIQNLPCILIDGELAFSSIIPSNRELVARLERALEARRDASR